jgi:peptidylprolyl isomerase
MHRFLVPLLLGIVLACSSPPGAEPEAAPVASQEGSGDENPGSDVPVDVACATISADPGWGCPDDPKARGRAGQICASGNQMEQIPGAYSFPEAPVDAGSMPDGVHVTDSGLGTCVVRAGSGGDHPTQNDYVEVHYLGWNQTDGVFDSSVSRGSPARFRLDQVIAGWTEGVQLMAPGEVRRFFIPEYLAYQGRPGRPGGMLLFDVELLDVSDTE